MNTLKNGNSSYSSPLIIQNFNQKEDGYSESSSYFSSEEDNFLESHIDITKYLPEANPLIPKIHCDQFEVRTANGIQLEKLPNFNKARNYAFQERFEKNLSLQEYIAEEQSKKEDIIKENQVKGRSLFENHKSLKDKIAYQKYLDLNLDTPSQISNNVFFATYIVHLKHFIKSSKKNKDSQVKKINAPLKKFTFSSNFESGNLFCAYKISENEYDLVLQNDINTKGNTQWFFFSVSNTKPGQSIKFNILNLIKSGSLFSEGLCPVVYSTKQNQKDGQEWIRDGFNIKYSKGDILRDGFKDKNYYTLSFSYYFQYLNDVVYFAHSYPYTYTNLKEYLNQIMKNDLKNKIISIKPIARTLAGNICDQLTITSSSMARRSSRKGIVIFARQHPGETNASYMMQGCIDFLLGDSKEAIYLRESCVFKIIPMVNPDGVIHGNYRCSLAGCDLNRRWKKPHKKLHPTIYGIKEMIKSFSKEREIFLIIDLHGHSRKMNSFFYGCNYKEDAILTRFFPYLMSKNSEYISMKDCRFSMSKCKEKTARISLWKELKIPNIFTLESSFYGMRKEARNVHYTIQDQLNIGRDICLNLFQVLEEDQTKRMKEISEIKVNLPKIIENEQQNNEQSFESDSNPSEDELEDEQMVKILPKSVYSKKQTKILQLIKEREKEAKKKEIYNKKIQRKSEVFHTYEVQNTQEIQKKQTFMQRFIPKMVQKQEKIVLNKSLEVPKSNIQMVDVAVQTEASFIMEMKAYLMQKQVGNGSENAVKQRNVFNQANSLKSIRENNHVTFSQFDEKVNGSNSVRIKNLMHVQKGNSYGRVFYLYLNYIYISKD